ncbi:hypothetical protein [Dankookia rubra]|nr:hypothetical protein [Dankookia rubra]
MRRAVVLLLLALGACAGGGMSGPYVGGAAGGNLRDGTRSR